ncbi:MAG: hypothetical protein AAGJ46_12805 [Planctomycetota bacterium]
MRETEVPLASVTLECWVGQPLGTEQLSEIVRTSRVRRDSSAGCVVVASQSGVDNATRSAVFASAFKRWERGVSLLVADVVRDDLLFRPEDRMAHGFADAWRHAGQDTDQDFCAAAVWLRGQLPLVASVASQRLAAEHGWAVEGVECAMRLLARETKGLTLYKTLEHGLVLAPIVGPRTNADLPWPGN